MRNIRPLRSAILLMAFTCTAFIVVSPKLVNAQVQQQHQARFFSALPDMPIPDGFEELTDSVTIFDKAEGRLLDFAAFSSSQQACQGALAFYASTLPYLGWKKHGAAYYREGEVLSLALAFENKESCLLTLSVRPK
tara:strand:- start:267937 stop:268344 length:408 start_codon:yes stop_codon:yes gene_type:complete